MDRFLGLDYGEKRIGVAISDEKGSFALPLFVLENQGEKTFSALKKELEKREYQIQAIALGYPLLLNGKDSPFCAQVNQFKEALEKAFPVQVILIDERFTSECAHSYLREMSLTRKERKKQVDASSSALILQSYLDKRLSATIS